MEHKVFKWIFNWISMTCMLQQQQTVYGSSPTFEVHRKATESDELHFFMDVQQPTRMPAMFTEIQGRSDHLECASAGDGDDPASKMSLASGSSGRLTCFTRAKYQARGINLV